MRKLHCKIKYDTKKSQQLCLIAQINQQFTVKLKLVCCEYEIFGCKQTIKNIQIHRLEAEFCDFCSLQLHIKLCT